MSISVECHSCRKNYRLNDNVAGMTFKCQACGEPVSVPGHVAAASRFRLLPVLLLPLLLIILLLVRLGVRKGGPGEITNWSSPAPAKVPPGDVGRAGQPVPASLLEGTRFATLGPEATEQTTVQFASQTVSPTNNLATISAAADRVVDLSQAVDCRPLTADPFPQLPQLTSGRTIAMPQDDSESYSLEGLNGVATLNTSQSLVAISLAGKSAKSSTHVVAGQLSSGQFHPLFTVPQKCMILDHHEHSGTTLFLARVEDAENSRMELVIMGGLPEGRPLELYRRTLPSEMRFTGDLRMQQGKLITGVFAVLRTANDIVGLDLAKGKILYRIPIGYTGEPQCLRFSGSGKWMVVADRHAFHLFEALTGEPVGTVPLQHCSLPGLCFHPDGRRIGFCSGRDWGVWDIVDARMLAEHVSARTLGNEILGWLGQDCFFTSEGVLFDSAMSTNLWSYVHQHRDFRILWQNTLLVQSRQQANRFTALPVPDDVAFSRVIRMDQEKREAVLAPGDAVSIEVPRSPSYTSAELATALGKTVLRAGLKVDQQSKLVLTARFGKGEKQPVSTSGPIYGLNSQVDSPNPTLTVQRFTCTLELWKDGVLVWSEKQDTETGSLYAEAGETVMDTISRYETPNALYLERLQFPTVLYRNLPAVGWGESRLQNDQWLTEKAF